MCFFHSSAILFLSLFASIKPDASLEILIKNDTGKQKPTRIDRTPKMKKKTSSMGVHEKMLISISNAPVKQAIMPMIERAANEMTPVLVIFCSMFCSFIMLQSKI